MTVTFKIRTVDGQIQDSLKIHDPWSMIFPAEVSSSLHYEEEKINRYKVSRGCVIVAPFVVTQVWSESACHMNAMHVTRGDTMKYI